jgi:hypothetical protein
MSMAEPIVRDADDRLRAPRNIREAISLGAAFAVCFGAAFAISPLVALLSFVPDELRGYLNGLPLGGVLALHATFNRVLTAAAARDGGVERPDLPPWPVTGLMAAASLFAWNWFVSFLAKTAMAQAFSGGADGDPELLRAGVASAASIISVALTLLAVVLTGRMLNRFTRTGVAAALILTGLAYLALQLGLSYYFNPVEFEGLVRDSLSGGAGSIAGMVVGLLIIPIGIVLAGTVGVLYSRIARERSMGRLVNAARRLDDDARHAVTEDVLRRVAQGQTTP